MSAQIDPRGQRFAATLTAVLLAVVLLTAPSTTATVLLAVQTAGFALGAVAGVRRTPYSWMYRVVVQPQLPKPRELEDGAPPRFAQGVGLGFALVGLVGYLVGADLVGAIATGFALGAAFLNAVFGLCLGCECYLLLRRMAPARNPNVTHRQSTSQSTRGHSTSNLDNHRTGQNPVATKG